MITTVAKPRVHVYRDFRLHSIIIIIIASLTKCVIRSLLCKPLAFSPAITRTWNTLSRTESACVESTTSHYNRGARGRTYTPADHRRMRLRGNVYCSSITDVYGKPFVSKLILCMRYFKWITEHRIHAECVP